VRSKRRSKTSRKISKTWIQLKSFSRYSLVTLCVLVFVAVLAGCAALQKKTPEDRQAEEQARSLLSRLTAANQGLRNFKGIGRIQLDTGSRTAINERAVWVASVPVKLSIVVLVSGLPALKFASDGQHLYFVDMRDPAGSFQKIRSSDPQLDRLISIPVRSSDIVQLLAGRPPIRDHTRVRLTTTDAGVRLLILERWWQVVQKIHVDPQRDEVQMVEFFDGRGQPAYRAMFEDLRAAASYRVPRKIRIIGGSGAWLLLSIERLFPDADIAPEMFVLNPPGRDAAAAAR